MDPQERKALTDAARFGRKQPASGRDGLAITSHPVATRIATDVLRRGGNAVDAALAASVAQTVVEPHMTTLCGVLSLLHFDAANGETTYLNGSMARPAALTSFDVSDVPTARSVAIPGFWAAFEAALARHGSLPKPELVAPAIALADEGFEVHPFLYGTAFEHMGPLGRYAGGREVFFPEGRLVEVGEVLRQPRLAETLARLVEDGCDHFYRGGFAERMVATVQAAGGVLTRADLEDYEVIWAEPARGTYRDCEVVGSPPPDRGGTHVIEILNLVEQLPLHAWGPPTQSPDMLHWLARFCAEVYAEGFAQRDPRDAPLDLERLTSKALAEERFARMQRTPPSAAASSAYPGSNHVTVVDAAGNVATLLHSVMSLPWTHGLYVDGVPLWAGAVHFLGNLPGPGRRGSCFVAPTIVFRDGAPLLAAGSPSQGLIANLVQNTLNIVDFGLDVTASVHQPRFGGTVSIEAVLGGGQVRQVIESDFPEDVRDAAARRGSAWEVVNPWHVHCGSYEGIHVVDGVATACADPRRTGRAEAV